VDCIIYFNVYLFLKKVFLLPHSPNKSILKDRIRESDFFD
jgi:hypothetical protein